MAPKKGKAKALPALSNKEKNDINKKMATFLGDPDAKKEHWAGLAEAKRLAANKLYEDYRKNGDYIGGPNAKKNQKGEGSKDETASEAFVAGHQESSTQRANPDLDIPPMETQEDGGSSDTEATGEGTDAKHTTGEDIVIRVQTDRTMPRAEDAVPRTTNGVEMNFDPDAVIFRLAELHNSKGDSKSPFPIREKFRTSESKVFTNRFRVNVHATTQLHEFEIVGIPPGVSRRVKKFYVDTAIEKCTVFANNKDHFATDFNKTIIAWKDLREDLKQSAKWDQKATGWHLVDIKDGEYRVLPLYLRHIRIVDTASLQRYVKSEVGDYSWNPLTWDQQVNDNSSNKDTVLNALNIIVSKCFGGGYFKLGANKFFVEAGHKVLTSGFQKNPSPLTAVRGYFYSIRPGMGQIYLNVNACTSAFLRPIRLSELMSAENQKIFENDYPSFLTGLRVYIDYERGRTAKAQSSRLNQDESRIKKICGLGKPCNKQTFMLKKRDNDGNVVQEYEIDLATYLDQAYQHKLRAPDLPAVNLGSRQNESWFAPEDLMIMPFQVYSRAVPGVLMASMHDIARKKPIENRSLIEGEGMSKLLITANPVPPELQTIPLTISPEMLIVPSATLKRPKIVYGNTSFTMGLDAKWDLKDYQFYSTTLAKNGSLRRISYVVIYDRWLDPESEKIKRIKKNYERQMKDRNVGEAICKRHLLVNLSKKGDVETNLRSTLREAGECKPDLIICILRNQDQHVYSTFKYLADTIFGFQSMVFVSKRAFKPNEGHLDQYIGNIMMKANIKLQGINHTAESSDPRYGNLQEWLADTMVLGADVTHPSGGALPGCPSVAAVVGSVDTSGGKFLGSVRLQSEANKEMIDGDALKDMVRERVHYWAYANKKLPKNILYYRDGVSESQYLTVKNEELPQIVKGFKAVFDKQDSKEKVPDVKITAVVVTKRHHTRFYPKTGRDEQEGNKNCRPGTVIDTVITSPYFTDFYLQSHNGIVGTAKPAHYWVLQNDIPNMSVFDIQHLTHTLCHCYVRATMAVSYAAPAYYADRLCERARCYLRDYFTPPQADREYWDQRRQEEEKKQGLRQHRPLDRDAERGMSREQREREREALKARKEKVEKVVMGGVYDEARRRFEVGAGDGDFDRERTDALLETMYWM